MCYAQPGPRCSNHATEKLARATKAYEANPSRQVLYEAMREAQDEYDTTPVGIKQLRAEGKTFQADIAQQTRAVQLAELKKKQRDKQTIALKQLASEQPVKTWGGGYLSTDEQRWNAASDETTSPEDLDVLSRVDDADITYAVAINPTTSEATLNRLIAGSQRLKRAIAEEAVNAAVLNRLANDKEISVREGVASNLNTPVETLNRLANDENWGVREDVASNLNTPVETLNRLAQKKDDDTNEYVRQAVARNPNTPTETLEQLAGSEDYFVRGAVARNPSTPPRVVVGLRKDEDDDVREKANYILTKPYLVEALKADFPEANTDMPREWLMDLLSTR